MVQRGRVPFNVRLVLRLEPVVVVAWALLIAISENASRGRFCEQVCRVALIVRADNVHFEI